MLIRRYRVEVFIQYAGNDPQRWSTKWVTVKYFYFWQYSKAREYCIETFYNDGNKQPRRIMDNIDGGLCYFIEARDELKRGDILKRL